MDRARANALVTRAWDESIVPVLVEYIRIPNQSPAFDKDWEAHGHMEKAVQLVAAWCREQPLAGMTLEVVRLPGRTPVLFMDVPGSRPGTVLLYGHLDKQPPMTGWEDGLGPWTPVLREGKLYGRGGADDGYAAFASLTALRALQEQGVPHARCVVLIEACEESGSTDLPAHIEQLKARLGTPELIVCLDSGCGNYEQLWTTTSLRGIVPSSFRILRQLLGRLEDGATGRVLLPELFVDVPDQRRAQAAAAAQVLAGDIHAKFPFVPGCRPMHTDPVELVLARTWRPALSVTGADGLPPTAAAGNVLRPRTALQLSMRLPPTCDARAALARMQAVLESDPPCGARVRFRADVPAAGWNAPELAPWLERSMNEASRSWFGAPACAMGEGGSIPFMAMLGAQFPQAQFLITGVLGPRSNAHGPNEFLHLETARRLTGCVAQVVADHARAAGA